MWVDSVKSKMTFKPCLAASSNMRSKSPSSILPGSGAIQFQEVKVRTESKPALLMVAKSSSHISMGGMGAR